MTDQAARDEALSIERSFIVQAPAGSGKTTLLISRYMCLLAIAEQPEEVLAITFTRKATAEMRKRIIEALDPDNPVTLPQDAAKQAVAKVRQRSAKLGWNLLEQPSRLQIMTIDSFCTSLIRRMPWASRFGSLPGIVEDSERLCEAAVLNLYESAHQHEDLRKALKELLRHLDNNSTTLQTLIVQLLLKRDQWLRHMVNSSFSKADQNRMEGLWQSVIKEQLNLTRSMMPDLARDSLKVDSIDNANPDSVTQWKEIANALLTRQGTWKKRITRPIYLGLSREELEEIIIDCSKVPGLRTRLTQTQNEYPSTRYVEGQWQVLHACSVVLQHAVAELKLEFRKHGQVDFIEIAQQAVAALGDAQNPTDLSLVLDYQYRHIMVDEFQDTSFSQRDLLELLTAGWQPDDGRTIFLVGDPMQSIYRFREAEVGIYLSVMERGLGNLSLKPLHLTQNFRSNQDLVKWFNEVFEPSFPARVELETGSVPYVGCTTANAPVKEQAISIKIANKNPIHTLKKDESGGVVRKNIINRILPQWEADELLSDLKKYRDLNPRPDVRVAILVRSRTHAKQIMSRLTQESIKFYAAEFIPLNERPVVEDLLSLTRALLNLADRTSWMAILRAPWCGLSLADLLVIGEHKSELIWERLSDEAVRSALSDDGRERVERVYEVLVKTFVARGRLEMRQWIHDCWLLLGGPASVALHDNKNAHLFFDLIERNSRGNSVDGLDRFEEKIARLYAVPEIGPDDSWLHISTIHSAKGLEYDAVFLPRFHADRLGKPSTPLLAWSEFIHEGTGAEMLLSPIVPTGTDREGTMYKFLLDWDRNRHNIELMRLAYVACTRAKQALYIYAASRNYYTSPPKIESLPFEENPPKQRSLFSLMWPGILASRLSGVDYVGFWKPEQEEAQEKILESYADTVDEKEPSFPLSRLPLDWHLPPAPAPVKVPDRDLESPEHRESIDFDWAGSIALWVGNVVHEWLEKIVHTDINNWNADKLAKERTKWRTRLLEMGMNSDEESLEDALARIETALKHVLQDSTGQWILSNDHLESKAELRLTGYIKGQFKNVILDRTFIDQTGTRWIIDYKSGTTSGNVETFLDQEVNRYRDQLSTYKLIVSGMDSRPIRTALYFPMFPAWREVD